MSANIDGQPPQPPNPFFIVGAQRSGTTMLRLMLNSHPLLSVPFESGFVTDFYRKVDEYGDLHDEDNVRRLLGDIAEYPLVKKGGLVKQPDLILARRPSSYASLVDAIFSVDMQAKGKQIWGDKTPDYVTELDIISRLFPTCRVIHAVRDGRDVVLSNRSLEWGIRSLPRAAEDWRWKVMLGRKMGSMLGERYLEVRYEDLVLNTRHTLEVIAEFLRVPFDDRMLTYHEHGEQDMPAESLRWHANSVRPPDSSLVQAWKRKMSRTDRIIFEQIAGHELADFGYEVENIPPTLASRLKLVYHATMRRW